MSKRPSLVAIPYSPWSLKAAWALHLRSIDHRVRHYTPTLGELGLRLRLGRFSGRMSVPVLLGTDVGAIEDSWNIALWADAHGRGASLFPELEAVERWNEQSERALEIGRRRSTMALIDDPTALDEASSRSYPAFVAPALRPIARAIAKRTMGKYDAEQPAGLAAALDALREGLGGRKYLIGDAPSYADVVMAVVLEYVRPSELAERGPAERRIWTDAELTEHYSDLLAWRDALIAETGFSGVG